MIEMEYILIRYRQVQYNFRKPLGGSRKFSTFQLKLLYQLSLWDRNTSHPSAP